MKNMSFFKSVVFALLSLIFSFGIERIAAQEDSLMQQLEGLSKREQVIHLLKRSEKFRFQYPEKSRNVAKKAMVVAEKNDDDSLRMIAYRGYGLAQKTIGNYDSSFFYYDKAFDIAKELEDSLCQGTIFRLRGTTFRRKGEIDLAFESYYAAARIFELLKDTLELVKSYNDMGVLYNGGLYADFSKALANFKKCAAVIEQLKDTNMLSILYPNMAYAYQGLAQYDSAIYYLGIIIDWNKNNNNLASSVIDLRVLSTIYQKKGELDNALNTSLEGLEIARQLNDNQSLIEALQNTCYIYLELKQAEKALPLARESLKLSLKVNSNHRRLFSYQYLYRSFELTKNLDSAFYYIKIYATEKDTMTSANLTRKLAEMETKYETEKKDIEIQLLTAEQELSQQELNRKQQQQISLIIIFSFLIVLAGYFVYSNRQKHRLKEEVLRNQVASMQDQVWRLTRNDPGKSEVTLQKLNEQLINPLTSREMEVLELILQNAPNPEIAEKLFISINTVKFHLKNLYEKLDVENRRQAVQLIIKSSS